MRGRVLERCDVCGFEWESVAATEVVPRVIAGSHRIAELLRSAPDLASLRPAQDRWSALEYGGHVRDVMLHLRDRFVIGLVEDHATFKPLYRDQRVALGLYAPDDVDTVGLELEVAANLFGRSFDVLSADQLQRECEYAYPAVAQRSLLWMGQQVVHEVEHHLGDIEFDLAHVS